MEKGHWSVVAEGRKEAAVPWGLQRREGIGSLCSEDWSPTLSFPGPMGRWVLRPHHQDHQAQGASVIS